MYGHNSSLAYTGAGSLMIGGVAVGLNWVIAGAFATIVLGVLALRLNARRRRVKARA